MGRSARGQQVQDGTCIRVVRVVMTASAAAIDKRMHST